MNNKKITILFILIATITLLGIVGFTIAYFTSSTDFENEFNTALYQTEATETFTSPQNWLPGDTTPKELTITNTGETNVAVRVRVSEEWTSANGDILPNEVNGASVAIINLINTSDWVKEGEYYYYKNELEPNDETSSFIESVTFNPNIEADIECTTIGNTKTCTSTGDGYDNATYTLTLTVETIQSNAVEDAWAWEFPGRGLAMQKILTAYADSSNTGVYKTQEGTEDIYYYTKGDNANVLFNGFCWQIVRTTASGGIKLIYNGVAENNKCETNRSPVMTVNGESGNSRLLNSDYKYGTDYIVNDNDTFTLTGDITNFIYSNSTAVNAQGKYTCANSSGTCSNIYFVSKSATSTSGYATKYTRGLAASYQILGKVAFETSFNSIPSFSYISTYNGVTFDSSAKAYLEKWYRENMLNKSRKIEDTVWCYDKTVVSSEYVGEDLDYYAYYTEYNNSTVVNLTCNNVTDQFSVSNESAKLNYPVGLINNGEAILMGETYRNIGVDYWLFSPSQYAEPKMYNKFVSSSGSISDTFIYFPKGLRPSIVLIPGVDFVGDATGSASNPYIVK